MTSGERRLSPRGSSGPILIIPAAGMGSRLGSDTPKFLVPVAGRAMVDRLIDLYRPMIARVVLVVAPAAAGIARSRFADSGVIVDVMVQDTPTGMLDAVLLAGAPVSAGDAERVWITWCDQVAIHPDTVDRLREQSDAAPDAAIVMPVASRPDPYIHFERDRDGRITRVRQRREGDAMPAVGESDAGLFSLSRHAFLTQLPEYAAGVGAGASTGERNLLPFIPWVASRGGVITFPCRDEIEAVGINNREELALVEAYLLARDAG